MFTISFRPQRMKEECFLPGPLEPNNEMYAIAKIAGIKMCEAYNCQYRTSCFFTIQTNLYAVEDHYGLHNSHVLPALICKMHDAKHGGQKRLYSRVTGTPHREFLHCDDLADGVVFYYHWKERLFSPRYL